jgi:hypothetical protein
MSNKTRVKVDEFEADIVRLSKDCKLDGWMSLVDEVKVPPDIFAALFTGRPEVIKLIKARDLTAAEAAPLFAVIATLIETNAALREHAVMTARLVNNWADAFKQLHGVGKKVQRFASFDSIAEGDHYA